MRHFFSLLAISAALAACGDSSGPSNLVPDELAGFWEASPACLPECGFTLQRISNPADSINFVSALEQSFVVNLTTSGRFNLTSAGAGITLRGRVEAVDGMLVLEDEAGVRDTADYVLQGEYLSLMFRNTTENFDFDADGQGDPALVRARFRARD